MEEWTMDNKPQYSGSLTREQFLYYENRIVAKLILQGKSYDEILKEATEENLFQYPSTVSYKLITRACYKRLMFTGDLRIVELVANANSSTSKLAFLYCMMCQNLFVKKVSSVNFSLILSNLSFMLDIFNTS